jgi:hypothetical protein
MKISVANMAFKSQGKQQPKFTHLAGTAFRITHSNCRTTARPAVLSRRFHEQVFGCVFLLIIIFLTRRVAVTKGSMKSPPTVCHPVALSPHHLRLAIRLASLFSPALLNPINP